MADLAKIKRNVAKMASMGAPTQDIDGYIASEGTTVDEIRNFKVQEEPSFLNKLAGITSKGVSEVSKFNPIQTFLRQNEEQRATIRGGLESRPNRPYGVNVAGELGADVVDLFGDPKNIIAGELGGAALGGVAGRVATTPMGRKLITEQLPTLGKNLLKETANLPVTSIQPKEVIKKATDFLPKPSEVIENITPSGIKKGVRKYLTKRKPYTERTTTNLALTAEKRLSNLKSQAKTKYGEPIDLEKEILKQNLEKISTKEQTAIEGTENILKQRKLQLKEDIKNLSSKMEKETTPLKENINIQAQKSAIEGKRRLPQFITENSSSYGKKLDNIIEIAEKENKLPTRSNLQSIFDETDAELADMFVDSGAPLKKYNAIKNKYLGGLGAETNPEAMALEKALGVKKGGLKGAGINWSRVAPESQITPPNPDAPINIKGLLKDIRSVSKAMSAKAKGAIREFTDEDLAAIVFEKNIGKHLSDTYPDFAKLQKAYAPIMEQMKAGRKLFKPGEKYNLGEAPSVISKPDIMQKQLMGELEKGTPEFNQGIGEISQPVSKAQSKLAGAEKGFKIAREDLEKLGEKDIQEIESLLNIKKEAYKLAKSKITIQSLAKQKALEKDLLKRLNSLEGRETKVGLIRPREKMFSIERKAATGGGIITVIDYLMRAIIRRSVLR